MAGIEKVCEFSGEYPGWEMYDYKRNHIQVMPKYRKEFRGKDAVLYVVKRDLLVDYGNFTMKANLDCINPNPTEADWDSWKYERVVHYPYPGVKEILGTFFENKKQYCEHLKTEHKRLVQEYEFILHVPDVPGEVNGMYVNYTTDLTSTVRRLKRMLRARELEVMFLSEEEYEMIVRSTGEECDSW